MANIKSAKKRAKQTVVRNARNAAQRSQLRTAVKKVLKALDANDAPGAEAAFATAQPILDRFSARGLIHKNKADLMFEDEAAERAAQIVAELGWDQPWFLVSALGREGTWPIMLEVMAFLDRQRAAEAEAREQAAG